jgi:hypothetical protein
VHQLAKSMDEIDTRSRAELPEIGEIFIDVTEHSSRDETGSAADHPAGSIPIWPRR